MEFIENYYTNNPLVIKLFFLAFAGVFIRQALVIVGQRWANTYHHLGSYILLPGIALVITLAIKDDLALSLGMVGALSIVRFRNPVKSPFELVMFFALLTLGITCNVSLSLSFKLFLLVIFVIFGIKIADYISNKFRINIFQYSFGDGNLLYTLEINSNQELDDVIDKKNLINFFNDKEKKLYSYRLVFKSKNDLIDFEKILKKDSRILNVRADMQS